MVATDENAQEQKPKISKLSIFAVGELNTCYSTFYEKVKGKVML